MKKIYKYTVNHTQRIEMPKDATFLTAQVQHGNICIWAEVELEKEMTTYLVHVIPTGDAAPSPALTYLGTVQLMEGVFVYHIYY